MKKEVLKLGSFEVVSGVLRISDPCYDKKTWCAGTVEKAKLGTWKARVTKIDEEDNWGNRCRKIVALHKTFAGEKFKKLKIDVGVDSGQAGIFDDQFYQVDYTEDYKQVGRAEYDKKAYRSDVTITPDIYESLIKQTEEILNSSDTTGFHVEQLKKNVEFFKRRLSELKENKTTEPSVTTTRDWYEVCCDKTLSNVGAGVIRNGVVSSSGDGDGSYVAYAAYNSNGEVVGVKILF